MTKSRHDGGFLARPLLYRAIRPACLPPLDRSRRASPKPPRHKNLVLRENEYFFRCEKWRNPLRGLASRWFFQDVLNLACFRSVLSLASQFQKPAAKGKRLLSPTRSGIPRKVCIIPMTQKSCAWFRPGTPSRGPDQAAPLFRFYYAGRTNA